jgi:hypothetical protein
VEITDSAVLVAEEMSDISWEDLIDMYADVDMHASPSAYISEPCLGGCDCNQDPGLNTSHD